MATTAFGALNTILIGIALPAGDVAYWSVCMQIIGAVQTMYSPIIDGVYPEMVKTKSTTLIKKMLTVFMPIIVLGCFFSIVMAELALVIVGGEQYRGAANIFRLLIPVLFFSFPGMLIGWPVLGAIGKVKEVTTSTILTAIFQITGLGVLILTNSFNLYLLALLRSITEFLLFAIRLRYCVKNRKEFT